MSDLRTKHNLNRRELADLIESRVGSATLGKYEYGDGAYKFATVIDLCLAMNEDPVSVINAVAERAHELFSAATPPVIGPSEWEQGKEHWNRRIREMRLAGNADPTLTITYSLLKEGQRFALKALMLDLPAESIADLLSINIRQLDVLLAILCRQFEQSTVPGLVHLCANLFTERNVS